MAEVEKNGKPEKAKEQKPNFFVRTGSRMSRWFREMKSELKKVVWPTRSQTVNNTLIVIACVLVVGVFIWAFDWLAAAVVKALINLFG